jgi:hypothetical protein
MISLFLSLLPLVVLFLLYYLPIRVRFWVAAGSVILAAALLMLACFNVWPAVPAADWAVISALCTCQAILAACCRLLGLFGCLSLAIGWLPFLIALSDPGQFFETPRVKSQAIHAEYTCRISDSQGPEANMGPGYVVVVSKRLPYLPFLERRVTAIWDNRDHGPDAICADVVARHRAAIAAR